MTLRKYKVERSKFYTEEKKHLHSSYEYSYYANEKWGWQRVKNNNSIDKLRAKILENPEIAGQIIESKPLYNREV